ncbi:MAG: methyl-accepting chemotaxis protein [Pseudomonadota bacterium]
MLRNLLKSNETDSAAEQNEHNAKLAYIIDSSEAAFMMVDRDFVITYANKATMSILRDNHTEFRKIWSGFDAEKIIGTCIDRFHKDPSHQRSMMSTPMQQPFKTRIKVGELTFALTVTAMFDTAGEYCGNTLEWLDITNEIESIRRDIEQRCRIEATTASQAVVEFDLDGKILAANDNFCQVMGYASHDIVGKQHRVLVDEQQAASAEYTQFWQKLQAGESTSGEYRRVAKDGSTVWIRGTYAPIKDELDKVIKVIETSDDITSDKRLRDEINDALAETAEVMKSVSDGDLTQRVAGNYSKTLDELKLSVNNTLEQLCGTIAEITGVADTVGQGAREISQGNNNLSERTEQQASSLEETASSMEEMTATVQSNADNAAEAKHLSADAHDNARKGGDVVKSAVEAMDEISRSSGKISDIIGVIDEIAFQTNLLALNASVEAARAGEQGRGFAVVASEVRNLAGRSATAAKEIKELIQDSAGKVSEGSRLVNQSGETLNVIVQSVKKVSDIIADIATASVEQSEGISQVNSAISQMDDLTQQNAALVEESAAASETLNNQAQSLSHLVQNFRLPSGAIARISASSGQVERRSASRPWADKAPASSPRRGNNVIPEPTVANSGDHDEAWETF